MMNAELILILGLTGAFAVGFLCAFFIVKFRMSARLLKNEEVIRQISEKATQLEFENSQLKTSHSELQDRLQKESVRQGILNEKLNTLEDTEKKLVEFLEKTTAKALEHNNRSFLDLAKSTLEKYQEEAKGDLKLKFSKIEHIVNPLSESLDKVNAHIKDLEVKRVESYTSLKGYLDSLKESQEKLTGETSNLVNALRSPVVRGRWGEIQLRKVVELAGMEKHCDFDEQISVKSDDKRLRPDMIINLPGAKSIIVDSKAPLQAFIDSLESNDDKVKKDLLTVHARHIKTHINQLSSKEYWSQFAESPEFVVMFLPGENFFSAALGEAPDLIEYGFQKRVLLATPTTLIALLKSAYYGWQQEKMAENARQISEYGKELVERISVFVKHMNDLRKSLDRSVDTYNKAAASFESRVMVTARKLESAGVESKEAIQELEPVDKITRPISLPEQSD